MTKHRLAAGLASLAAGLNFLTAGLHFSAYSKVVSQAPTPDLSALMAALWLVSGIVLLIAALIAVAATPLFVVRRRAFLYLAASIPISIAGCQIAFLGFLAPTAILLVDGLLLVAAAELGRESQARPSVQTEPVRA